MFSTFRRWVACLLMIAPVLSMACSSSEPTPVVDASVDASPADAPSSDAPDATPDAGPCGKRGESCTRGGCCAGSCLSVTTTDDEGGVVTRSFCE